MNKTHPNYTREISPFDWIFSVFFSKFENLFNGLTEMKISNRIASLVAENLTALNFIFHSFTTGQNLKKIETDNRNNVQFMLQI